MGKVALDGQPGICDTVKAVRSRPFAEWNVVYYDPAKTTPKKILDRLRAKGCPKARAVPACEARIGEKLSAVVRNPVAVPGDCFDLVLSLPEGVTYQLDLPKGWREIAGAAKKGSKRVYLQTPSTALEKVHQVTINLTKGGQRRSLTLSAELVRQVP